MTVEKTGLLSYCARWLGNFFPKFRPFKTSGINYPTTCRNNPEVVLQQYGKKKFATNQIFQRCPFLVSKRQASRLT